MYRQLEELRDQLARPTLQYLEKQAETVSDELKPLLESMANRLFDPTFDASVLYRQSSLSESHTSARFNQELGATPAALLTHYRLKVGASLLRETDHRVFQIAAAVGYTATRCTFSDAFQRWSGQTPTEYRAASRGVEAGELVKPKAGPEPLVEAPDDLIQTLAARLGLAVHERGARRAWDGDQRGADADLSLAHCCYVVAGELPRDIERRRRFISLPPSLTEAPVELAPPFMESACSCASEDPHQCRILNGFAGTPPCTCDCHPRKNC